MNLLAVQTSADIDKVSPDLPSGDRKRRNLFILKQRLQYAAELFSECHWYRNYKEANLLSRNGEKRARASEREVHELLVHLTSSRT